MTDEELIAALAREGPAHPRVSELCHALRDEAAHEYGSNGDVVLIRMLIAKCEMLDAKLRLAGVQDND